MSTITTPPTIAITFVVRFWREWTGAESRWRGRVEHVESGQQASFLEIEDLLDFFERFGFGGEGPPAGRSEDTTKPTMHWMGVIDPS